MDAQEVVRHAESLRVRIREYARHDTNGDYGQAAKAQVCEFFRNYGGPKSAFLQQAEAAHGYSGYLVTTLDAILKSFIEYLQSGLATGVAPERQAQMDIVSDLWDKPIRYSRTASITPPPLQYSSVHASRSS